jgi:regulatory protein YycI of two-component signal transduction system YycFG
MKKKKRIVYNLCLAVLICIFLGSAGYLAYYFLQSKKSEDQFQELEAMIDAPVNEEEIVYVATDGDAEPGLEFVNIDGTRYTACYQTKNYPINYVHIVSPC